MDMSTNAVFDTIVAVDGFTIDVAADRTADYDTLLYKGRRVTEVEARIVEAQFRLPDGTALVFLNDDEQFKEMLTVVLVGPGLDVLDQMRLGGAYTPGYFTYAYPSGPDEIAFCWHDLEQLVTVRPHRRRLGLRRRWLRVREIHVQAPKPARARAAERVRPPSRKRRIAARGAIPALAWLAWLRLRTVRFGRKPAGCDGEPRR